MAINPSKLLPSSNSNNIVLYKGNSQSLIKGMTSSDGIQQQTKKIPNKIFIIKTQVIKIEKLVNQKYLENIKRQKESAKIDEKKSRKKQEEKLEKTTENEEKAPGVKLPPLGFLDGIKNFIGNMILGFIAFRLIKYLPEITNFLKILSPAVDFFIDFSGKMLNGLVTFIDWGYKAYDATRGFLKNIGGDNLTKIFDTFNGAVGNIVTAAIAASFALSDMMKDDFYNKPDFQRGIDRFGRRAGTRAQQRYLQRYGEQKFAERFGEKALQRLATQGAEKGAEQVIEKGLLRTFVKRIPWIGGLLDFALNYFVFHEPLGESAFRAAGSTIAGMIGTAIGSIPVLIPFGGPLIGGILGGWAGDALASVIYDMIFNNKKPKAQKIDKKAEGGIPAAPTRGGKKASSVRRSAPRTKKQSRQIKKLPTKLDPGRSIGGIEKIKKVFPGDVDKPTKDKVNPLGYMKNSYDKLSSTSGFGGLAALFMKAQLGEKPSNLDYENAAIGLQTWMQRTFSDGVLRTGGGFAEGGQVDAGMFSSDSDMRNMIAKSIQDSVAPKIDDTINDLMKQLKLKGAEPEKPSGGGTGPGDDGGGGMELNGNLASKSVQLSKRLQQMFGLKDFQAAAIVGTWLREGFGSGFPDVIQGGKRGAPEYNAPQSKGYGFAQWTNTQGGGPNDRLNRALIFLGMKDNPRPWTVDDNLKVFKWEIEQKGYGSAISELKKTTNLTDAVRTFVGIYEAGGMRNIAKYEGQEGGGFIDRRLSSAKGVLKYMTSGKDDQGKPLQQAIFTEDVKPTGSNGKLDPSKLITVQGSYQLRNDAAQAFINAAAAAKKSGVNLSLSSAYRSYEKQAALYANRASNPYPVAAPGTSNHGYGIAVDIPEGTPGHTWMRTYGRQFGWKNLPGDAVHFDYVGGTKAMFKGGRVSKPTFALIGEKGSEFIFDADTTKGLDSFAPFLLDRLNMAKTKSQIASILQYYMAYESGAVQNIIVEQDNHVVEDTNQMSSSKGSFVSLSKGSHHDPFEILDRLPG